MTTHADNPLATLSTPAREEWLFCLTHAEPRRRRTLREFAEAEIYIPEGPYQGLPYRVSRQPFAGLLFDAIDSGQWTRVAAVGCVQSGKSLQTWVLPIVYTLFELGETCIAGVPDMHATAADKWSKEILPVIELTRYASLLPTKGKGSKGGTPEAIEFGNGATLKFMSGTGSDAKRSSFTARIACLTEVDKYDTAGAASKETGPVGQMEARTLAFDDDRRIFLECTPTHDEGRIWLEYAGGTQSRIVCECPHCGKWQTPERENLKGWQEATGAADASRKAFFECAECAKPWTEAQRRRMNQSAKLIHAGQEIGPDGEIHGKPVETATLGFRWNAFNNLFWRSGTIGAKEFSVAAGADEEDGEKELLQFWWGLPFEPKEIDIAPIDPEQLKRRTSRLPRGQAPAETVAISVGVDVGKYLLHYVSIAWLPDTTGHVIDYGVVEADADSLGINWAAKVALRELRDLLMAGYTVQGAADPMVPGQVWIDSGWEVTQPEIYAFCRAPEHRGRFWPTKGYGYLQQTDRVYRAPTKKTREIRIIGRDYHFARQREHKVDLVHLNSDVWKTDVRDRLGRPEDQSGALLLFLAPANEHQRFSKHIDAERPKEIDHPTRGRVTIWEPVRRANHYLDASAYACAAGHRAWTLATAKSGVQPGGWFAAQEQGRRTRRREPIEQEAQP